MPTPSYDLAAAAGANGLFYVFGGYNNNGILNTTQSYLPPANGSATAAVTVAAQPIVTSPGNQNVNEGSATLALGSFTDSNSFDSSWLVSVNWGDGSGNSTFSATSTGSLGSLAHTYTKYGTDTVTVTVTVPNIANLSASASFTVNVADLPPVLTPPSNQYTMERSAATVALGSFTDPGSSDSPWLVNVTWGDGSSNSTFSVNSLGSLGSLSHTYSTYGIDTVTVTVTDSGNLSGSGSFTVTVGSLPPLVSVLPITPQEGLSFSGVVADVSDSANNEPASDYSALINWGDGSGSSTAALSGPTGGPFTVSNSHTYGQQGQYSVSVSIVNNAPPVTWTTVAGMPTATYLASAAAGANGVLYVFGGYNDGFLNTVQAYNPATNTWTTEASMPTATYGAVAALGSNGLLYVFGGGNSNGNSLNTVEAYNPTTNTWTTEANMPTGTEFATAVADPNGFIYVFGGSVSGDTTINTTVQVYNPANNSWIIEAPMPIGSEHNAAALGLNGLIYVFGGVYLDANNGTFPPLYTVQAYNPATNTWTTETSMPILQGDLAAAASANGLLYALGGNGQTGSIPNLTGLRTVQVYNPSTNTWTTGPNLPTPSDAPSAAMGANGDIYVFGGYDANNGGWLNKVQALDTNTGAGSTPIQVIDQAPVVSALPIGSLPAGTAFNGVVATFTDLGGAEPAANYSASINWGDGSITGSTSIAYNSGTGVFTVYGTHTYTSPGHDTLTVTVTDDGGVAGASSWTTVDPMPTASRESAAASAYGLLYVFGEANNSNVPVNTVQAYNPATNTWTTETPMPTASEELAAAAGGNGLLYVFGGSNGSNALSTVQAYNPAANTWTTEASMPTACFNITAAVGANGLIYVFGGQQTGGGVLSTVQAYNPLTNTWTTEPSMLTATFSSAAAAGANGLLYVFGGSNGSNALSAVQAYNPATNTWTTEASMLTASEQLAAAASSNGLIYVFGGSNGSNALSTVQVYNPATNTWSTALNMPTASGGLAATSGADGQLYVFGGINASSGYLNTVQVYDAPGASGSSTATATVGNPPTKIAVSSGSGQSVTVNMAFAAPLVATVTDVNGNPVPGAIVTFAGPGSGAGATFSGNDTATTNAQGQVSLTLAANTIAGSYTVTASVPGVSAGANFVLTNLPGIPATVTASPADSQSVTVNTPLSNPLIATVTDAFGNPIPNVSVLYIGPYSGAGINFNGNDTATTNAQGQASLTPTANTIAGSYTVMAIVAGATTANISLTNSAGKAAAIAYTSGGGSTLVKTAFAMPLVVTVTDAFKNPVPGAIVTFTDPSGGAGVAFNGDDTVATNAQGQASFIATANTSAGSYTVTATVSGVATGVNFTLTNTVLTPSSLPQGYSPTQIQQAYGFGEDSFTNGTNSILGNGAGQTIAIMVAYSQPKIMQDLSAFDAAFGLPNPPSFTIVTPPGVSVPPAPPGYWGLEASLDVEWTHALAPGANIVLVEAASTGTDLFSAVDMARQMQDVSVISMSWGFPEFSDETFYDQYFTTPAGHIGETFIAATGDEAAPGEYPAYSPNVLAVGGTAFDTSLNAQGSYPGEVGWSFSGGGISQYESQPSFQTGVVAQSTTARTIPDVSFDAAGGVAVYDSYDEGTSTPWISEAETSLAAPSWAALIATADQGSTLLGQATLTGSAVSSVLYDIAASSNTAGFNEITSGSNNSFAATSGYNLVTGLGTPKAAELEAGLSGNLGTPTPLSPTGTEHATTIPTFQWSAVPGALGYHLVAIDQSTNATVLNINVPGATSYTPSSQAFFPGHSYQWYVQAYPVFAGQGAPSDTVTFNNLDLVNAPTLTTPLNDSVVTSDATTFTWTLTAEATSYDLILVDEAQPDVVVDSIQTSQGGSYTLTTPLLAGHVYQWYLQVYEDTSPIAFSAVNTFYYHNSPGTTLLAPAANTTVTTDTPTFQWSAVTGATGYEFSLFDTTLNFALLTDFSVSSGTPSPSFTPNVPLTNNHAYEWSVSVEGLPANMTATANFTVSLASGGTGNLATPRLSNSPSGIILTNQPTFEWSPVTGATGYGLYLFQDGASTSTLGGPISLAGNGSTSYAAPALLNLSSPVAGATPSFLWWVVAYDNAGNVSQPSQPLSFNISLPGTGLGTPAIVGPVGIDSKTYTPIFQWTPASRAASYTLDLIDQTSNAAILDENVGNTTSDTLGLGGGGIAQLTNGHNYLWYVEAIGSTSPYYGPASFATFTVSVPTGNGQLTAESPTAGATIITTKPTLVWTAVSGAAYYLLSLSGSNPQQIPVSGSTGNQSFTLSQPLLNGVTYQWQVTAYVNNNGVNLPGPADQPQEFIVDAPGTPLLYSPNQTSATTVTPTFQWSAIAGAASYDLYVEDTTSNVLSKYEINVSMGGSDTVSYSLTNTSLTNGHAYQWYVVALDATGDVGISPNPLTFTVPVGTPDLLGLSGNVNSDSPTLQWSTVPGAIGYYVTVQQIDPTTKTVLATILNRLPVIGSTSYTLSGLTNTDTYQWDVQAFNGQNDSGAAAKANIFSVYIPDLLPAPTPSLTNTLSATAPVFQWSAVPNAVDYELDVTETSTGSVGNIILSATNLGNVTSDTATTNLPVTSTFEWSVLAIDSLGNESAWSTPVQFTVVPPPPPPVAPMFTSGTTTTFVVGTAGSFQVTASGTPSPSLSESGTVPGVLFNSSTGVLSGTPTTPGDDSLTFTATNLGGTNSQNFVLVVDAAPVFTSGGSATFMVGMPGSFTISASGTPLPILSDNSTPPPGVTFNPATGVLSGTPTTPGSALLTFTASNGVGSPAILSFTLFVDAAPAFTSSTTTTFVADNAGSITVTASGTPAPTLSESGALPSGVTFTPATGVLGGTPVAGTAGTYPLTFTAGNGVGGNATQSFTLVVDEVPVFTSSATTTFVVGINSTVTISASGTPSSTLGESGALPQGITFNAVTGVLRGTPAAGTVSTTYPLTFTATNSAGSVTQNYTFIVSPTGTPPAFTSAPSTTFMVGLAGSFTVIAGGAPPPALSESGALPPGVTFDSANGVLGGTPAAGTAGTYTLAFTAGNGVGNNATQSFTLVVDAPPAFTSSDSATFLTTVPESFSVTVTGTPTVTVTESGALPNGITFNSATAVLSGQALPGTNGSYVLTFVASNSAGSTSQTLTLTINSPIDELGAYRASDGSWSLQSDPTTQTFTATDQVFYSFSPAHVTGVAGDWTGSGSTDIGDFNPATGVWHLDLNNNGVLVAGETFQFGQAGDQPVVGDWTGNGVTDIGVFRANSDGTGEFILDTNGDHVMDAGDESFSFGLATDRIVIGDWNGAGKDEVGVFREAVASGFPAQYAGDAVFSLDTNGDHTFDSGDQVFVFGLYTDGLIVGDWNGGGKTLIGVYREAGSSGFPAQDKGDAIVSLDSNGDGVFDKGDAIFLYGLDSDQFVAGHWAKTPPVQPEGTPQAQFAANGAGPGGVAPLTQAQLEPVLQQAIAAWVADGASATQLEAAQVQIGTLDDNLVGEASGNQITLDSTADGWGWNTDSSNTDFTSTGVDGLQVTPGSAAAYQMDLLTVVEHELGHELGLSDVDPTTNPTSLMAATLALGIRRQPTTQELDTLFASLGSLPS